MNALTPLAFAIAATSGVSTMPLVTSTGPNPVLPEPQKALLPTVKVARATGWSGNDAPIAAAGFAVSAFAKDLAHPRWILVLPNGDALVAESDAPAKPDDGKGIKGKVMGGEAGAILPFLLGAR